MKPIELVARSSSHYSRVARIFAVELGVPFTLRPVFDLAAMDTAVYGNNPAMKIPVLVDEHGPLFGTENICQELVRRSGKGSRVVLRGAVNHRLVANMEEMTLHAMSTEVTIILAKASQTPVAPKVMRSLTNTLDYLNEHIDAALQALPADRQLSFLEVALFCLVEHLPFRQILDVSPWKNLCAFADAFRTRQCAQATAYHFDVAPQEKP